MSRLLFTCILLLSIYSCSTREQERINGRPYRIAYNQLKVDTVIREIVYFNGNYLCLQDDLKIAVFDSNLVRKKVIEDSINIFPISNLYINSDTVFLFKNEPNLIGYPQNEFYFTGDFEIQSRKYLIEGPSWPVNSRPLYADSIYDVYANSIGLGGFLVFFYNKKSKETFSTWSSGPRQVFIYNNNYYVAEEGNYKVSPAFRIISDPTKLIKVPDERVPGMIQVFQHLAPSPGTYYEQLADSIEKSAGVIYGSSQGRHFIPIYTFEKENQLYTIIKGDSTIYLAVHESDSLTKVQTILDTSIEMQHFYYGRINENHFITFQADGGKTIDNKMQRYSNSGFILIKDSLISFNYYYFRKPYDM
jgi:hypothetical protein